MFITLVLFECCKMPILKKKYLCAPYVLHGLRNPRIGGLHLPLRLRLDYFIFRAAKS